MGKGFRLSSIDLLYMGKGLDQSSRLGLYFVSSSYICINHYTLCSRLCIRVILWIKFFTFERHTTILYIQLLPQCRKKGFCTITEEEEETTNYISEQAGSRSIAYFYNTYYHQSEHTQASLHNSSYSLGCTSLQIFATVVCCLLYF